MGDKALANNPAMIQDLESRRENQGLGQKPVMKAENIPRIGRLWLAQVNTWKLGEERTSKEHLCPHMSYSQSLPGLSYFQFLSFLLPAFR